MDLGSLKNQSEPREKPKQIKEKKINKQDRKGTIEIQLNIQKLQQWR